MSYVVHVTAVVEGDIDKIEGLINQYRYKCLENQPGMQQFYVCRHLEQQNVFLYTQIFKDQEAHQSHLEGDDPKMRLMSFLIFEDLGVEKNILLL